MRSRVLARGGSLRTRPSRVLARGGSLRTRPSRVLARGGSLRTRPNRVLARGTGTVELPRVGEPGSGLEDNWRVIVLNDDHNTFEGVARALSRVLPGVTYEGGMGLANKIHTSGQAIVWAGPREPAELYWEQLEAAGLTMAPLEQG